MDILLALVLIKILVYNNYDMNPISQIKLEREDKRIKLTLPYNPTHIKKIKTISDYRWHPDKKHWSFPYSEDIFKKILSLKDYLFYLAEEKKAATSTLKKIDILYFPALHWRF